jgi:hypothetical protein
MGGFRMVLEVVLKEELSVLRRVPHRSRWCCNLGPEITKYTTHSIRTRNDLPEVIPHQGAKLGGG